MKYLKPYPCFALQWEPTLKGYLQFLGESKVVYETFEDIMKQASHPECECAAVLALQEQLFIPKR